MHFIKKYIEESFEIIELSNQFINAKIVVQQGFNLFSLVYKNIETIYFDKTLIENFQDRKLAGIPFMHPWANRLDRDKIFNRSFTMNDILNAVLYRDGNNLALHGLILKSDKWQIIDMSATDLKASCTAKLAFNETHLLDLFPFKHNIFITLELESEKLFYKVEIENLSSNEMPICFGFHPYFNIKHSENNILIVPDAEVALVDEKLIPTNKYDEKEALFSFKENQIPIKNQNIDHAFLHQNQNENYQLKTDNYLVTFNLDENYTVVQIYHPNNEQKPYICIEPMTALANALNTGNYNTIAPNSKFNAVFSIEYCSTIEH
ncbi:MAG TPA: aldose 1-epimerase [Chitinophagales bacterium]|nr:aldose 1-epimerase [Chitinophagales bacterium]HMV01846.1 aldose 1-epimerase [Chitinophagales bacterium]HMW93720.1 aldose 1-epimerase [Chitinophagales bacterium]HMZ67794.1 aldose 1-epimerase [Chitinophagales bacterium]HMZ93531.1 aldose 1-epimerase [Chitinophagales bacterium]